MRPPPVPMYSPDSDIDMPFGMKHFRRIYSSDEELARFHRCTAACLENRLVYCPFVLIAAYQALDDSFPAHTI